VLALVEEASLCVCLDLLVNLLVHFLERFLTLIDELYFLRSVLSRIKKVALALGSHGHLG
jgi:hypothetical protein